MKRLLTLLSTTLLLAAALAVGACAADFEPMARELSTIGVFRGTETGLALERAPTRQDAAAMLVRLYGAETQAMADYNAGIISHPFTDVRGWSSPYVAWLYTKGLTNGTSATTFGAANPCTAQMYCTFLLRALGYQDGADFTYDQALGLAQSLRFYDPLLFSGDFLRDDLAAVTYQALAIDLKDGSTYLLDSLVQSGAVSAAAAAPLQEKMDTYRAMNRANDDANSADAIDMDFHMVTELDTTAHGQTEHVSTVTNSSLQRKTADANHVDLAYVSDTATNGEPQSSLKAHLKDNWMYVSTATDQGLVQYKRSVKDAMSALEGMGIVPVTGVAVGGLALVDSIAARAEGDSTVYDLRISGAMAGYMPFIRELTASLRDANIRDMKFTDLRMSVTAGADNTLKAISMSFGITAKGQAAELAYQYEIDMTIHHMGSGVVIAYPDFTDYVELDPNAA